MIKPLFRIHAAGNTGNRMFQYMLGLALQAHRSDLTIAGQDIPMWGQLGIRKHPPRSTEFVLKGHSIPWAELVQLATQLDDLEVIHGGVAMRMANYDQHLDLYRSTFPPPAGERRGGGDGDLVINIRLLDDNEVMHPNYVPLPISYYRRLIKETGLRPIFMGQLGDNPYCHALHANFPDATFLPSMGAQHDFDYLRNSAHIVLSVSSFAWLAAWFSETAKSIHLPVMGLYHPGFRPEIDCLPLNDSRYRFYLSGIGRWDGDIAKVSLMDDDLTPATAADLKSAYPKLGTDGFLRPSTSPQQEGL